MIFRLPLNDQGQLWVFRVRRLRTTALYQRQMAWYLKPKGNIKKHDLLVALRNGVGQHLVCSFLIQKILMQQKVYNIFPFRDGGDDPTQKL